MTARPDILHLTRRLLWLNAAVWLSFGLISLLRLGSDGRTSTITLLIMAVLMTGNAAALFLAGCGLDKHRLFHPFAFIIILVNILLTFTDEFGLFDFLTLLLDGFILFLLWRLKP